MYTLHASPPAECPTGSPFRLALQQRPVHRTRDFEDQLAEAPEVSQGPVKGRNRGNVHFGAGDLLQQAREAAVTPRPPGGPADDHYWCVRHEGEYLRPSARSGLEAVYHELDG